MSRISLKVEPEPCPSLVREDRCFAAFGATQCPFYGIFFGQTRPKREKRESSKTGHGCSQAGRLCDIAQCTLVSPHDTPEVVVN